MRWIIREWPGPSADGLGPRLAPNNSVLLKNMKWAFFIILPRSGNEPQPIFWSVLRGLVSRNSIDIFIFLPRSGNEPQPIFWSVLGDPVFRNSLDIFTEIWKRAVAISEQFGFLPKAAAYFLVRFEGLVFRNS